MRIWAKLVDILVEHLLQLLLAFRQISIFNLACRSHFVVVNSSSCPLCVYNTVVDNIEVRVLNLVLSIVDAIGLLESFLAEWILVINVMLVAIQLTCTLLRQSIRGSPVVFGVVEHFQVVVLLSMGVLNRALLVRLRNSLDFVLFPFSFLVQTRSLTIQKVARTDVTLVHLNLMILFFL